MKMVTISILVSRPKLVQFEEYSGRVGMQISLLIRILRYILSCSWCFLVARIEISARQKCCDCRQRPHYLHEETGFISSSFSSKTPTPVGTDPIYQSSKHQNYGTSCRYQEGLVLCCLHSNGIYK